MKKLVFLFLGLMTQWAFGQSVISGVVIDGDFNEPLAFANVVLKAQGSDAVLGGSITDFEGRYSFDVSRSGTYELTFSYLGYETKLISDIQVGASEEKEVTVVLNPLSNALDEVVVTTSARKNSESSVLAIQKGAVILMDGLSAQNIRKTGDGNVAAAIKRIPGVSVQGGKFVYVRGLGDRYSKTLLGGLEVPGLDPDKNTLQLDIFPTGLLDNILVSKSASAEMGADFTGGIVDVVLRDFSTLPEYSVTVSTNYNSDTNLQEAPALPESSLNPLSFDSGNNDLPFSSTRQIPLPESFLTPVEERVLVNSTKALNRQMGVSRENNLMDYSIGMTASNQYTLTDKTSLGYIAALNYKYDSDYYAEFFNGTVSKEADLGVIPYNSQQGELGTIQAIGSGMFGLSLKSGNTKHKILALAIKSGESNAIDGVLQDFIENPYYGAANIMTHTERNILTIPVTGSYKLDKWSIDWKVAPSVVSVKDLDFRKAVFNQLPDGTRLISNNTTTFPERLWRNLDENSLAGKLDFKYDFKLGDKESQLKFGGAYLSKDRTFSTDRFSIGYEGPSAELGGDFDNILNPNFIWSVAKGKGSYLFGEFQPTDQYESTSQTLAGYVSNDIKFSDKFKTVLGVRYEMYTTTYTGENIERQQFNEEEFIDVADFYPSANLIYSFNEATNLRFSYSKTTARPSFRENSAAQIYDPITERFFLGNTDLTPTYVDNLDMRWEKFGEGNQITAMSLFYKKFTDPIEIFYYSITAPNVLIGRNNEEAVVYGAEFEYRKNLIDTELDRLSLNLNASVIVSELQMSEQEYQGRKVNEPNRDISDVRQLQGQSPYLINAGVNYNLFAKAIEAGIYYNVQGRALQVIGVGSLPDVYTEPFHGLNVNLSKSFGQDNKKTLSLKVENLLNDVRESRFDYFGNTEYLFSSLKPGMDVSLGFAYKF